MKTQKQNLEEEKDLLLMLIANLKKKQRKKLNALNLLSNRILSADKNKLKTYEKVVHNLCETEDN